MGIRLTVAAGYALDLKANGLDPSALHSDWLEDPDLFMTWREAVLDHAKTREDVMDQAMLSPHTDHPLSCMMDMTVYCDEGGFEDKVLLVPGMSPNLVRYADPLDTFVAEATNPKVYDDGLEPEMLSLPGTLYPYVGLMRPDASQPLGVEKFWEPCYRDNPKFKDSIAWAPWHLWFLIKHVWQLGDDKTTEVFLTLRPSVYRYWS